MQGRIIISSEEQRILAFVNKAMIKICKLLNNSYQKAVEILQGHMKPVRRFDSLHNKRKQKSADLLGCTPNLHRVWVQNICLLHSNIH